ncbi:putative rnase p rpr2 rpp21 snm1 subunit domain-containing protein [Botrytis fragariae]|uniref:Putative rnase p rpr2 rpp21 snm1 subunit domain-containing protein n=1 Tax=Botrytis fragariae TaxID=1964551 RepID=A0A8H6AKT9_9HELO|nr:putative rnase p rpr2 rpp21 snm1 subunit domain-containing protein [Botrytis fragariae]KAF5869095.1 putative rnase p rpr2 rpp21 snm1 subunit domain-containing protein [Botrytis fragariae]
MADLELAARLQYLNEAAHFLATSAPTTSRYLGSQRNSLMFDHEIEQPDLSKRGSCSACGTIMILGSEGKLKVKSQSIKKKPVRKGAKGASSVEKAMVYTCGSCTKITRHRLAPAPVASRSKNGTVQHGAVSKSNPLAAQNLTTANTMGTPSTNASSKKRAKNRKLGGLGALLAKQKASQTSSSGFGLDLMDLMKKS